MTAGFVIGLGLIVAHVLLFGGVGYAFYNVRKATREGAAGGPQPGSEPG
ncbi:hypothetical protein [Acidimangrovimonas pyrenivorans]|uniref:Uncharacterized protein n=1 Tax=Acidimangrovimonas pyrenivorans TaxID=2030798 RepID=A0ABV7ADI8_9RHOB